MIDIDSVYQKVLAIANKEQRGYITPQEFNLLADKAQFELFEAYFHDLKMAYQKPKNDSVYSDEIGILLEKLQLFRVQSLANELDVPYITNTSGLAISSIDLGLLTVPIYRLDTVVFSDVDEDNAVTSESECVELTKKENMAAQSNPLTKATSKRPTFVREGNKILKIYHSSVDSAIKLSFYYWRKPAIPKWRYVLVDQKALYNANTSTNFEIHPSEKENLVTRILILAGVIMEKPQLTQAAVVDEANTLRKQND
tara:strand:- start:516 stop:1280 length:765 start_codon:yes stop_codon:yes gene_type:complete